MKTFGKMEYWLDIADYDIKTSYYMQKSGRYLYSVFMCQQAIEKILKTLHIQKFGKEAPLSGLPSKFVGVKSFYCSDRNTR